MGFLGLGKQKSLIQTVQEGDLKAVRKLLKKGANPNRPKPDEDMYPIHYALRHGPEMVQLLVEHGANVNMPANGKTPLAMAEEEGYAKVAETLSEAGGRLLGGKVSLMDARTKVQINERIRVLVRKTQLHFPKDNQRGILDRVKPLIVYPYPKDMTQKEQENIKEEIHELIVEDIKRQS